MVDERVAPSWFVPIQSLPLLFLFCEIWQRTGATHSLFFHFFHRRFGVNKHSEQIKGWLLQ
jgi:hypothetical protein